MRARHAPATPCPHPSPAQCPAPPADLPPPKRSRVPRSGPPHRTSPDAALCRRLVAAESRCELTRLYRVLVRLNPPASPLRDQLVELYRASWQRVVAVRVWRLA